MTLKKKNGSQKILSLSNGQKQGRNCFEIIHQKCEPKKSRSSVHPRPNNIWMGLHKTDLHNHIALKYMYVSPAVQGAKMRQKRLN